MKSFFSGLPFSRIVFLNFLFWTPSLSAQQMTSSKRRVRSKQNITVVDPVMPKKDAAPSPSTASALSGPGADEISVPSALSGERPHHQSSKKGEVWFQPELSQEKLSSIDISSIRKLIQAGLQQEAVATLDLWLALRRDVHTGERLRLQLIRAGLLYNLGKFLEAEEALYFSKKYLQLASEDLKAIADRKRIAELSSYVDLSLFQLSESLSHKELLP